MASVVNRQGIIHRRNAAGISSSPHCLPTNTIASLNRSISCPSNSRALSTEPEIPSSACTFQVADSAMLTVLQDGGMVEVATIGREGMVGVSAVIDGNPVSSTVMVQGETDTCYRMKADLFRREVDRRGVFCELLTYYAQALMGFVMQSTACNAVHAVEQRLARWLLIARDGMGTQEFPLTPELVAMMLGASPPTVTIVAGTLQKAGLITYHRGHLAIVDGEGLEAAACECYRATTDLLDGVIEKSRR